ncbi:MAG: SGNH/GDSL hydrolase family protein [Actinomycetota bacterium]|nr:SGNH/GDSL hydrolase family protein [Actinomycetota bacterium]
MKARSLLVAVLLLVGCNSRPVLRYGPLTYVAIGASDTVGIGAADPDKDAWVAQLFAHLPAGSRFVRLGVSGSTAEQALTEQVPKAEEAKGDLVTVWLAVNDFNSLMPVERYAAALDSILIRTSVHGERVFVGNIPDLTTLPSYKAIPSNIVHGRVDEWNAEIRRVVAKDHAVLVDLVAPSRTLSAQGKSMISEDGFHPSTDGYRLLSDVFWAAISKDPKIGKRVSR